jgi:hypothetical protein
MNNPPENLAASQAGSNCKTIMAALTLLARSGAGRMAMIINFKETKLREAQRQVMERIARKIPWPGSTRASQHWPNCSC